MQGTQFYISIKPELGPILLEQCGPNVLVTNFCTVENFSTLTILHPNISMHILHTVLFIFLKVLHQLIISIILEKPCVIEYDVVNRNWMLITLKGLKPVASLYSGNI